MNNQEKTIARRFWEVTSLSALLFLALCWTQALQDNIGLWAYSICYFALTYYCLQRYHGEGESMMPLIMAVVLGRIMLEVPIRIIDYVGTLCSLMHPVVSIIAITLGGMCYSVRKPWAYAASIAIIILFIAFVTPVWTEYWHSMYANK